MRRARGNGFANRVAAGRQLGQELAAMGLGDVVVAGLPRGGVPVAAEVAAALGAPLDVVVVRKLGVPWQPEVAMGAVGEEGAFVVNPEIAARVPESDLAEATRRQRAEVERRVQAWRGPEDRVEVRGRTVVLVDDGIATGATMRAAVAVLRARGAAQVIVAVPVAASDALEMLQPLVDDVVCPLVPEELYAVGAWYDDFRQVDDDVVRELLRRARRTGVGAGAAVASSARRPEGAIGGSGEVAPAGRGEGAASPQEPRAGGDAFPHDPRAPSHARPEAGQAVPHAVPGLPEPAEKGVRTSAGILPALVAVPHGAGGLVLFAHGSGSSRLSPRNNFVARMLNEAGLATMLLDLLTVTEARERSRVFDIELLAERLMDATRWAGADPLLGRLPLGYFGASTGAAAALRAAAERPARLGAVVSRGGRPDLADHHLGRVAAPTLLVVGELDQQVLELNRWAQAGLTCPNELAVVPGATHLFEEPGTLEQAGALATAWFGRYLTGG
ncbi:phosphoribosyltransferase family protein [Georgenia sp. AZ-5]|uniref:phosphoribosyltransferase family protein n=1 Tax=Georgenia sp. AZ-5 TaxID=3367526 RepID=UPI003754F4A0